MLFLVIRHSPELSESAAKLINRDSGVVFSGQYVTASTFQKARSILDRYLTGKPSLFLQVCRTFIFMMLCNLLLSLKNKREINMNTKYQMYQLRGPEYLIINDDLGERLLKFAQNKKPIFS